MNVPLTPLVLHSPSRPLLSETRFSGTVGSHLWRRAAPRGGDPVTSPSLFSTFFTLSCPQDLLARGDQAFKRSLLDPVFCLEHPLLVRYLKLPLLSQVVKWSLRWESEWDATHLQRAAEYAIEAFGLKVKETHGSLRVKGVCGLTEHSVLACGQAHSGGLKGRFRPVAKMYAVQVDRVTVLIERAEKDAGPRLALALMEFCNGEGMVDTALLASVTGTVCAFLDEEKRTMEKSREEEQQQGRWNHEPHQQVWKTDATGTTKRGRSETVRAQAGWQGGVGGDVRGLGAAPQRAGGMQKAHDPHGGTHGGTPAGDWIHREGGYVSWREAPREVDTMNGRTIGGDSKRLRVVKGQSDPEHTGGRGRPYS